MVIPREGVESFHLFCCPNTIQLKLVIPREGVESNLDVHALEVVYLVGCDPERGS